MMKQLYLGLFSLTVATLAHADEWAMDANIRQALSYNDNVRMAEDAQGSIVYQLTPELNVSHKTLNSELLGSVSYGVQRYLDIPELDSDNQNYRLQGSYQTESTRYAITTKFGLAPARNTAESDTGNFATDAEKTTWSIAPTIFHTITDRDTVSLSAKYSETTYSTSGFSDNENKSVNLAWQRQWTELFSGSISAFFSQFDSISATQETTSDSYGINFSVNYRLTDNWDITGTIGGRYTESTNTPFGSSVIKNQSQGFLSNTGVHYHGENLKASFSFNRSLTPSGSGQLNEQTRLSLDLSYELTKRVSMGLSSSYQTSESASSNESDKRENIIFQPRVNWNLTPEWVISGSYRYRLQDNSNQSNSVDSNTFMLTVNYNYQGLSIAR